MKIALVKIGTIKGSPTWNIGLLCLATYLHKHSAHRADIIDDAWCDPWSELRLSHYDVVGISCVTSTYEKACVLAGNIKNGLPGTKVIVGGVHVSTLPHSVRPCFDAAIPGEAENRLLHYLDTGDVDLSSNTNVNLTSYPQLDYSLLDQRYFTRRHMNVWEEQGVDSPIITSRGCPYKCVFCATTRFWNGIRYHTAEWTVNEMEALARRGTTILSVCDDLFCVNKPRLRKISDLMRSRGLSSHLRIVVQGKSNILDDEMCEILVGMGVKIINFGLESGSQRILDYLKCGTGTVEDHIKAFKLCKKHGIRIMGSLIMGSPGESLFDQLRSVSLSYRGAYYGADSIFHIALTPFPGTPVWEDAKRDGKVSDDMNFDEVQFFGKQYKSIPVVIHILMFVVKVFMKVRRVLRSKLSSWRRRQAFTQANCYKGRSVFRRSKPTKQSGT